jgi:hypothetical protein
VDEAEAEEVAVDTDVEEEEGEEEEDVGGSGGRVDCADGNADAGSGIVRATDSLGGWCC